MLLIFIVHYYVNCATVIRDISTRSPQAAIGHLLINAASPTYFDVLRPLNPLFAMPFNKRLNPLLAPFM